MSVSYPYPFLELPGRTGMSSHYGCVSPYCLCFWHPQGTVFCPWHCRCAHVTPTSSSTSTAETVNCVKTRLDRFWLNQDIIYIIIVLKFREPEAKVKLYSWIFTKVVVFLNRAKSLSPAPVFFLRLRLRVQENTRRMAISNGTSCISFYNQPREVVK